MIDSSTIADREIMPYDVVIVGAGPAGLAAAIQLRQQALANNTDLRVAVLEKGSEVGAHILSGAIFDPAALSRLIPDWQQRGAPVNIPVKHESFHIFGVSGDLRIPNILLPPLMHNKGCYIISLGALCQWMATQAETLGVDIFPGFAASELLADDQGRIIGVATGDMGLDRNGKPKPSYSRGVALTSQYTILAEGARGSLTKQAIARFGLDATSEDPKFGIGFKELWQLQPDRHHPGTVLHSLGWPLDRKTGGGGFAYHYHNNKLALGFVVHLNYRNPHLSPYGEFQRFKTHPLIRDLLHGANRIAYGARAITEGGYQSVPDLAFPGGVLIGCAAGFVNVPRIKGSHNAIESGRVAAQQIYAAINEGRKHDKLESWNHAYRNGPIAAELAQVRNIKPLWSRFGTIPGIALIGLELWLRTFMPKLPYTLKHSKDDHASLNLAANSRPIAYPKPDGTVSFDRLASVHLSNTHHEENQPVHLHLTDLDIPIKQNLPLYDEPAQRYCPAGVYEVSDAPNPRFVINPQNCVHCKTCDIKDPAQNITWVTPEGGGGPNYSDM